MAKKKLASHKHYGKDSRAVFLDIFLLSEFRSGASFTPTVDTMQDQELLLEN